MIAIRKLAWAGKHLTCCLAQEAFLETPLSTFVSLRSDAIAFERLLRSFKETSIATSDHYAA